MNAFESGARKVIPAVLIYVRTADDRVLMIHRVGKAGDYHSGKWNGLGGKLELDESPWQAARRELQEESGISLEESAFKMLGVLQFPNFKAYKNEDWIVYVFSARVQNERQTVPCSEGELHWIPANEVATLNLWAGDREFISYVIENQTFAGTIWYKGETVERAVVQKL